MSLLLDTSVLIWWAADHPRLTPSVRAAIVHARGPVHVSAASIWEAEIKIASGKLTVDGDLEDVVAAGAFLPLAITFAHGRRAARLPRLHADPFDRVLVAQAQAEGLALVTSDRRLREYDVAVVEA